MIAPFVLATLLTAPLLAGPPTLGPGRYAGIAETGRADLVLRADGGAVFGGAPMRWSMDDDVLVLTPPAGEPLRVTVRVTADGLMLDGTPFGALALRPRPAIEPIAAPEPVRPLDRVGGWVHRATGGMLKLKLRADGRYAMEQPGPTGAPVTTAGSWSGDDARLVLTPDGGRPLQYTARRDGDALLIGGGDLPVEVRFVLDQPR